MHIRADSSHNQSIFFCFPKGGRGEGCTLAYFVTCQPETCNPICDKTKDDKR